jgi:hypothetical protein
MDCPKKQEQREAAEKAKEGDEDPSTQNAQQLQKSTT